MKNRIWFLIFFALILLPLGCLGEAAQVTNASVEELPTLTVTSESLNADGWFLTVTAANRSPNKPRGENQSPQLTFSPVEGAACYAIVMFDTDANWLHFFVTDVTETTLPLGAYTDQKQYVGPYPPKGTGQHHYRLEVFALKAAPDKPYGKMNAQNKYDRIVEALDLASGETGNILLRGTLEGLYAYGKDVK